MPESLMIRSWGEAVCKGLYLVINSEDSLPVEKCQESILASCKFSWSLQCSSRKVDMLAALRTSEEGFLYCFCSSHFRHGGSSFTASPWEWEMKGNGDHKWQGSVWPCPLRLCVMQLRDIQSFRQHCRAKPNQKKKTLKKQDFRHCMQRIKMHALYN